VACSISDIRTNKLTNTHVREMKTLAKSPQILDLIKNIAQGMRDPDLVKQIITKERNRNPNPLYPEINHSFWEEHSVGGGYTGVLPLFAELDRLFPEEKWDDASHAYILKIKHSIEQQPITHFSLYGGLAGTCLALQQVVQTRGRYEKLLTTLNNHLLKNVEEKYLIPLNDNISKGEPSHPSLYELIQGVVGVGLYGLNNLSLPPFADLVNRILEVLVARVKPIKFEGNWVPGWFVPTNFLFSDAEKHNFPQGRFNLGLSHGIPGVLAFLAIASLKGVQVNGQKEAIQIISTWLQDYRRVDQGACFWESGISYEDRNSTIKERPFEGRDAWCYGTPGVARSLFLAGRALGNETLKQSALDSFCSLFLRTREAWLLPGPTFCHGISGLLMITLLMAKETPSPLLQDRVNQLEQTLISYYSSENPFGFKDFSQTREGTFAEIDRIDLLEGTPAILLTLLSLHAPTSWWHAPFLIGEGQ
jgi:lantibiotic biosynthesis protein